jgi:hypothetical protein
MHGGTPPSEEKKRRLVRYLEKELKSITKALKILVEVFEDRPNEFYAKYDLTDLKDKNESIFYDLEKVQLDVKEKLDKMKRELDIATNDPSNV